MLFKREDLRDRSSGFSGRATVADDGSAGRRRPPVGHYLLMQLGEHHYGIPIGVGYG